MPTEREKMVAGELFSAADPEIKAELLRTRKLLHELNHSGPDEDERRETILGKLFCNSEHLPWLEPPFYCDFGWNISLGEKVYFNFNCVILDGCPVTIGTNCLFAPNVQIYTATHPLDWRIRADWLENAKPVAVGDHVWVGGGSILLPGVTVGSRTVIGAGSVVTKDVPDGVLAAGNPARVIRGLEDGEGRPLPDGP